MEKFWPQSIKVENHRNKKPGDHCFESKSLGEDNGVLFNLQT
jgi:hypothetical protein